MMKITLINALTLLRIPLSLMFCTMILFYDYPLLPCAVLFLIIGASDYLDGKLARKYHVQTDIGARLDVTSDFFFIITTCLSWSYLGFFPIWMMGIIILKFIEFLITSFISRKNGQGITIFRFDPLGKGVAVVFYLFPVFVLLLLYGCSSPFRGLILNIICIIITSLAALSSIFRIISLVKIRKECIE